MTSPTIKTSRRTFLGTLSTGVADMESLRQQFRDSTPASRRRWASGENRPIRRQASASTTLCCTNGP